MAIPSEDGVNLALEQVLLHLKDHSPGLQQWMHSNSPRGTDGIDADFFRAGADERIRGLAYAVQLLAERCYQLQHEIERLQSN